MIKCRSLQSGAAKVSNCPTLELMAPITVRFSSNPLLSLRFDPTLWFDTLWPHTLGRTIIGELYLFVMTMEDNLALQNKIFDDKLCENITFSSPRRWKNKVGRCLARYSPRAKANNTIPCNTIRYIAMTWRTMQYHKMQSNTMQYHTMPCDTME